jgi:hypothetical protein
VFQATLTLSPPHRVPRSSHVQRGQKRTPLQRQTGRSRIEMTRSLTKARCKQMSCSSRKRIQSRTDAGSKIFIPRVCAYEHCQKARQENRTKRHSRYMNGGFLILSIIQTVRFLETYTPTARAYASKVTISTTTALLTTSRDTTISMRIC